MAPKSANNLDPYARAAFLAAQVDSLLGLAPAKSSAVPEISAPQSQKSQKSKEEPAPHPRATLRASRNRAVAKNLPAPGPDLERHSRKCQICRHPHREAIEADFIDWCNASWIEETYNLKDQSAIYRHARATGLDVRRRQNVRMVVEKILEDVDHTTAASPSSILRAVRTLACLNDRGQWIDPPTTHHVISTTQPPAQPLHPPTITSNVSSSDSSFELPAPGIQNSNRQTSEELEIAVSDSNQTAEVISNRQTKSIFPR